MERVRGHYTPADTYAAKMKHAVKIWGFFFPPLPFLNATVV